MKKKTLLIIVTITEILFAESPKTSEITFHSLKFNEDKINKSICDSIYSSLPVIETARFRATCLFAFDIISYNSPLDYSVLFEIENGQNMYIRREKQTCKNPFSSNEAEGTPGTAQFSEVLFAELMRLQKYGVIQNNRDSLEIFLNAEIEKMKEAYPCNDIDLVFYNEEYGANYGGWPSERGCCSLVNTSSNMLPTITFTTASIRATKTGKYLNKEYCFLR